MSCLWIMCVCVGMLWHSSISAVHVKKGGYHSWQHTGRAMPLKPHDSWVVNLVQMKAPKVESLAFLHEPAVSHSIPHT